MMVLGGGNRRQFHSCRHVLVYDPIERTWSKLATRGNAPAALIYHRWLLSLCWYIPVVGSVLVAEGGVRFGSYPETPVTLGLTR